MPKNFASITEIIVISYL